MSAHTVDNPFTLEPAASVALTAAAALDEALARAREASRALRRLSVAERVAMSARARDAFVAEAESTAAEITRSMGKPLAQARGEVSGTADRWRTMDALAERALADDVLSPKENFERRIERVPLGVVLDLPAWNYPLLTAVNCVAPAVVSGNAVLLKHSPRTPTLAEPFARAYLHAGFPEGAVQAIFLDYAGTEALVGDARVDHVVYTGSVHGGHRIQAAAAGRFLHVGLELGGNDPAYVAEDADIAKTAASLVDGAIYNAGQSCCAVERIFVHASVYDAFVSACEPLVRDYVLGDPAAASTTLGPIAQPWHPAELAAFVADATAHGARLVVGGRATAAGGRGRFFEATLLEGCSPRSRLFRSESFGPIVAVAKVRSDEEALAFMNDAELGLTASIWTNDRDRAARMARELEFGTVYMNRCDALDPELPWTGVKSSGRGSSLSRLGYDALTRPRAHHFRLAL